MTRPLVKNPNHIRLAMLGMVEGNGHPYSWSAIINGDYDRPAMENCGYPGIPQYLGAEPRENLGIEGATVTHVWCDDPKDTKHVAKAAKIQNIVKNPQDVIGEVDAVVIATDIGGEHVDRVRPFIEAGLPAFIDKPLTDQLDHLQQFAAWQKQGRPLMSSSCMRYAREYTALLDRMDELGELRVIQITMAKSWDRYGIHAVEGVYPFLQPGGWESVAHRGDANRSLMHLRHASGVDVMVNQVMDLYGGFGCLSLHGTKASLVTQFKDNFFAFKTQLAGFIEYLKTGVCPVDFTQTFEQMKIIIAGLRSRAEDGRTVDLMELTCD